MERILAGGFWRDGGGALSSAAASEAGSDQGLSMYMQARMRQEEREAEEALQVSGELRAAMLLKRQTSVAVGSPKYLLLLRVTVCRTSVMRPPPWPPGHIARLPPRVS